MLKTYLNKDELTKGCIALIPKKHQLINKLMKKIKDTKNINQLESLFINQANKSILNKITSLTISICNNTLISNLSQNCPNLQNLDISLLTDENLAKNLDFEPIFALKNFKTLTYNGGIITTMAPQKLYKEFNRKNDHIYINTFIK